MKLNNSGKATIIASILAVAFVFVAHFTFSAFSLRIFNLCGIYIILALSLNLLNGFTGLFSLGHSGFMAIGAYTCALLTMSPAQKEMNFYLDPINPVLAQIQLPFLVALLIAGIFAAIFGFAIGFPVLRLKDDYLAIATLGFSEIIRVVITNQQSITNGALGIKGLPRIPLGGTFIIWALVFLTVIFMAALINSAYGRALKSVRDNEIAAESMGIDVAGKKIASFTVSSFMAGIGGALLGHLMMTIDPRMFTFSLTYNVLLIVVLGGNGSITGSVISAIIVTVAMEVLRFLDGPLNFGFFQTNGLPGLRMVVFSLLLLLVVIYRQQGLMGTNEFSWTKIADFFKGLKNFKKISFKKRGRK